MKYILLFCFTILGFQLVLGQESETLFLGSDRNILSPDSFVIKRVITSTSTNYYEVIDYSDDNTLVNEFGYISEELVHPLDTNILVLYKENIKLDGDFISYYSEGKVRSKVTFTNGVQSSLYYSYSTNGDSTRYIIENMPEYPGGIKALVSHIRSEVKYPRKARKNGIEGKVIVEFIINSEGYVTNVKVTDSVHPLLDEEAIRVVSTLLKWIPATQDGEPVDVTQTIPINFKK